MRRDKAALFQWVQGPPGDSLPPEATGAGMEVTKCLKPSDSGHEFGDSASVQAATRVNAEQTSHDEGLVKGSHHGDIERSPVASVSKCAQAGVQGRVPQRWPWMPAFAGMTKTPESDTPAFAPRCWEER